MPTCREVTRLVASDQLLAARWTTRLMIRLHLWRCGPCRRYLIQLRLLARAARQWAEDDSGPGCARVLARLDADPEMRGRPPAV